MMEKLRNIEETDVPPQHLFWCLKEDPYPDPDDPDIEQAKEKAKEEAKRRVMRRMAFNILSDKETGFTYYTE